MPQKYIKKPPLSIVKSSLKQVYMFFKNYKKDKSSVNSATLGLFPTCLYSIKAVAVNACH